MVSASWFPTGQRFARRLPAKRDPERQPALAYWNRPLDLLAGGAVGPQPVAVLKSPFDVGCLGLALAIRLTRGLALTAACFLAADFSICLGFTAALGCFAGACSAAAWAADSTAAVTASGGWARAIAGGAPLPDRPARRGVSSRTVGALCASPPAPSFTGPASASGAVDCVVMRSAAVSGGAGEAGNAEVVSVGLGSSGSGLPAAAVSGAKVTETLAEDPAFVWPLPMAGVAEDPAGTTSTSMTNGPRRLVPGPGSVMSSGSSAESTTAWAATAPRAKRGRFNRR